MKMEIFSVYDEIAKTFGMPFFAQSAGVAQRSFHSLVLDEKSIVSQHPADYSLYNIGEFDDETNSIVSLNPPSLIIRASQIQRPVS